MRRERFEAMQPGGSGAGALLSMVRYALGNELEVDVTLVLDKRDVPPPVLGGGQGVSLGASAWLESARERVNHPDEMRYTLLK
jgi:type VI secretion system protein ImpH